MSKNEFEIMLNIMQQLDHGIEPKASVYGLTQNAFWEIVKECQDNGYIEGAVVAEGGRNNKTKIVFLNHAKLTDLGKTYLNEQL